MLLSLPPRSSSRSRLVPGLSLQAGDLLASRYRVSSLLRADRACAYLGGAAVGTGTNEPVEVQILLAMDDAIEQVRLHFLSEARKVAALDGPHVSRILHVGVTKDGHHFVVREPRLGQSLASLLEQQSSLPNESAVEIALALCEALEGAHALGVVHGELGPSTVQLSWTVDGPSDIKVTDLGTSGALATLPFDIRPVQALAIRAPELLHGEDDVDARADVWGIGVLLYTMLAGAPPYASESPSTLNLAVALDEPAMLAGVPDGLAAIVDACLSRDPAKRPASAAALAARLAPFGAHLVFAKRPSQLVVDTGQYEALALEKLVERARQQPSVRPEPSDVTIDVVLDSALEVEQTPEPVVVSSSVAPMAISVPPPAVASSTPLPLGPALPLRAQLEPAKASGARGRSTALIAAACITVGVVIGAATMRLSSHSGPPPAPAAAALPAAAEATPVQGDPVTPAPKPSTPAVAMPALAVTDLPGAATSPPPRRGAAGKARGAAGKPSAAQAVPEAPASPDPLVNSAAAPIQPEPKASDDDLRKFLDDRR